MIKYFKTILAGALIGIANAIPGVSGGTMAVILNMYDRILEAVTCKQLKKNLPFLLFLLIGAIIGIFAFSNVIVRIMGNHQVILNYCFTGLIIGSLPIIYQKTRDKKAKPRNIVLGIIALIFMIILAYFSTGSFATKTLADFGGMSWWFFLVLIAISFICSIAMILPGISGSLLFTLFGVYFVIITAVADRDFSVLLPVTIGVLAGLFFGVKVIKKMLRFHPQALYFIILGLIVGSVFCIFPGFTGNADSWIGLVCAIFFGLLAWLFSVKK